MIKCNTKVIIIFSTIFFQIIILSNFSCNQNLPPTPCLQLYDELSDFSKIKFRTIEQYSVDSLGNRLLYAKRKVAYNQYGLITQTQTWIDSISSFKEIISATEEIINIGTLVIKYSDFETNKNYYNKAVFSENSNLVKELLYFENDKMYLKEEFEYNEFSKFAKKYIHFNKKEKSRIDYEYFDNKILKMIKVSNSTGIRYYFKYDEENSNESEKVYNYYNSENIVQFKEIVSLDINNNPISVKRFYRDILSYITLIKYE